MQYTEHSVHHRSENWVKPSCVLLMRLLFQKRFNKNRLAAVALTFAFGSAASPSPPKGNTHTPDSFKTGLETFFIQEGVYVFELSFMTGVNYSFFIIVLSLWHSEVIDWRVSRTQER